MKKVFALIPARSGSKGVADKNIRELGGHTLLEWSIKACLKCKFINSVYVSTDSEHYRELAIDYGAKVPFLRPSEISGDFSTDYEMITHAIDWFKNNIEEPNFITHIRPTTPLRDPKLIDLAIKTFLDNSNATSLRSVHLMSESSYKTFELSNEGNLISVFSSENNIDSSNKPRQLFPDTYVANGYVDVLSTNYIRKYKSIHGDNVMPFLTPNVQEIDTEDDFLFLNYFLEQNPNIIKKVFL